MKLSCLAITALTAFALWSSACFAESPATERPVGFDPTDFSSVRGKSGIPVAVLEQFASLCGDCLLADVGEPFNSTDVITPALPARRLLVAGVSASTWFLEYEHGGRGLHSHFALFEMRDGHASCVWANGPPPRGCRPRAEVSEICAW